MRDEPIILAPGTGRGYDLGPMGGVFKADGAETTLDPGMWMRVVAPQP